MAAAIGTSENEDGPAKAGFDRGFWLQVAAWSALALALRAAYTLWVAPPVPSISDAAGYFHMGRLLAEGHGFVRWTEFAFAGRAVPSAEYAPLYPALLAALRWLGLESMDAQRMFVALLGAANVPLTALLAREIAGRRAALIAAALVAPAPALLANDGSFMREALYVPCVLAMLVAVAVGLRRWRSERRHAFGIWLGAGLLLGVAALVRSEAQMLLPLVVLPAAWLASRENSKRILVLAAVVGGFASVVLPWTLRNWIVLDAFVPISHNYKGALGGANCGATYQPGPFYGIWWFGCIAEIAQQAQAEGADAGEIAMANRNRDAGLAYALAHKAELPGVVLARLQRTWGFYKPGKWYGMGEKEVRNRDFARRTWWSGWLLLALLPIGLYSAARGSPIGAWLLLAPIVMASVTTIIGYGNPRFRAPAEPSLLICAAVVLSRAFAAVADARSEPHS